MPPTSPAPGAPSPTAASAARSGAARAPRIAVVGAGWAGLAAAWRLDRAGLEVVVFEAGDLPGGRAVHHVIERFTVEPGAQTPSDADLRFRRLVDEAGLGGELSPAHPSGIGLVHRGAVVPVDPCTPRGLLSTPGVRPWQAARLVRLQRLQDRFAGLLDPAAPERASRLDDRSVADFGRLYFGRTVVDRILAPALCAESPCDEHETSRVLGMLRWQTHRTARPLRLRWGLGALPRALAAQLPVRLGHRVEAVERADTGFALTVRDAERTRRERADAVILATPPEVTGAVAGNGLGFAERRFFAASRSVPAITVAVATERPFETRVQRVRFPHADRWPLEAIDCEHGGGRTPAGSGLLTAVATAEWSGQRMQAPDETVAKEILTLLETFYPGIGRAAVFTRVFRFPQAVPHFGVGRIRALAQLRRCEDAARAEGRRLYFAGDALAGPWLDSALASGERAAASLLADLD